MSATGRLLWIALTCALMSDANSAVQIARHTAMAAIATQGRMRGPEEAALE